MTTKQKKNIPSTHTIDMQQLAGEVQQWWKQIKQKQK
jgi:hypothetical protein